MSGDSTRRQVLAGGSLAALAALAGCMSVERDEEATTQERYVLDGVSALRLDNDNGSITVRGEERSDVALTGRKRAVSEDDLDTVRVEATRTGDALTLAVEHDGGHVFRLRPGPVMDLEVTVPEDLAIQRIETVNGGIEVVGVQGDVTVETVNGRVDVSDVQGGVTAETTNGGVSLTDVRGDVAVRTTNGAVSLVGIHGDVTAETTNGDISATDVAGRVTADTTNGDVNTQNVSGTVSRG